MSIETKLIAARPPEWEGRNDFIDAVMASIAPPQQTWKLPVFAFRKAHPVMFILMVVVLLSLITTSVYAVTCFYFWPSTHTEVNMTESLNNRDNVIVISENCDSNTASGRYELKKNASISLDQVDEAVAAACEYDAVYTWASETYPRTVPEFNNTPNYVIQNVKNVEVSYPGTISAVGADSIRVDGQDSRATNETHIDSSIKVIIDRQEAHISDLRVGDVVTTIWQSTSDYKNAADCNERHCGSEIIKDQTELVAIVRLSHPVEVYDWRGDLLKLGACYHNAQDTCHEETAGGIDLYTAQEVTSPFPVADDESSIATLEGALHSHDSQSFTISTSSGRLVTFKMPYDFITNFNASQSSLYSNTNVSKGDQLTITYWYDSESADKDTVAANAPMYVQLLLELESKAAPINKY